MYLAHNAMSGYTSTLCSRSSIHIIILALLFLSLLLKSLPLLCLLLLALDQSLPIHRTRRVELQPWRDAVQIKDMLAFTRQPDDQRVQVFEESIRADRTRVLGLEFGFRHAL